MMVIPVIGETFYDNINYILEALKASIVQRKSSVCVWFFFCFCF